jgi:hypothetical protein
VLAGSLNNKSELKILAGRLPKRLTMSLARRDLKLPQPVIALSETNGIVRSIAEPARNASFTDSADSGHGKS